MIPMVSAVFPVIASALPWAMVLKVTFHEVETGNRLIFEETRLKKDAYPEHSVPSCGSRLRRRVMLGGIWMPPESD